MAKRGYDPQIGARPLRRVITNLIEDPLSEGWLSQRFQHGDTVVVDVDENDLRLRSQREIEQTDSEPESVLV